LCFERLVCGVGVGVCVGGVGYVLWCWLWSWLVVLFEGMLCVVWCGAGGVVGCGWCGLLKCDWRRGMMFLCGGVVVIVVGVCGAGSGVRGLKRSPELHGLLSWSLQLVS
jgi:hypothetical protein